MKPTHGKFTPGLSCLAIGLLHQLFGLAAGLGLLPGAPGQAKSAPLLDLWRSGVIAQAESDPLRMAFVWYLLFGFMLIYAGLALHRLESSGGQLSRGLALGLASICALGALLMPLSGFWLGFFPAFQIWRRTRN